MQVLCVGQATMKLSKSGEQALPFFIGYSTRKDKFFVFRIPIGVEINDLEDCHAFKKYDFYLGEYAGKDSLNESNLVKKSSGVPEFFFYRDAVEQSILNLLRFWDLVVA